MKKIGFIDYYLDEFHANKYPDWIYEASGGTMKVAYAYGMKDKEGGLSNAAWCEQYGVEQVDSIEELVRLSDYIVVLSPDNPEMHWELSQLPLQSGKRTYIDKTFAPDRETAVRMFELAKAHGTPMYSTSALRYEEQYVRASREGIRSIESWGPGRYENYSIHQIEPVVSLMNSSPKRVMFTGTASNPALLIDFGDGRQAGIHHIGDNAPFTLGVSYENGHCSVLKAESNFFAAFIKELVSFFETGDVPVPSQQTIDVIAVIEYGAKAAERPYEWIDLP